ncbi:MAG: 30S ribosomal protein S15 [Gammaproteobacteria bacterium GWF2_41_13]|nr:MAG: 30S ribosomal protein S15 [Gammaproteobacteria bacterium GWF2_41_13]
MALSSAEKAQVIAAHRLSENDTGSTEVQIAVLTADIKKLTEHFKIFKKDFHSRRGLMQKVSLRRKLLKYLRANDLERYRKLIEELGLRDVG